MYWLDSKEGVEMKNFGDLLDVRMIKSKAVSILEYFNLVLEYESILIRIIFL